MYLRNITEFFLRISLLGNAWAYLKTPLIEPPCLVKNIYKVYLNHFQKANEVNVLKLQYNNEINYDTLEVMELFYNLDAKILSKKMVIKARTIDRLVNVTNIEVSEKYGVADVLRSRNLSTNSKRKLKLYHKISFESNRIRVIICADPLMLYHFLMRVKRKNFQVKSRCLNMILFSSENINLTEIQHILVFLWKTYGIMNVMAQTPLCCKYQDSFIVFKPFKRTTFGYGQIQIHHVDNILKHPHLLMNSVWQLNAYPLNVSMFEDNPIALRTLPKLLQDSKIYSKNSRPKIYGLDGVTIGYISQIMNFTIELCNISECQYYGMVSKNNTVIGSLGQIIHRVIDIQANARFIIDYGVNDFEFTNQIYHDNVCVVVRKAPRVPVWLKILTLLENYTGIVILIVFIVAITINKWLDNKRSSFSIVDSATEIYCILITQPKGSSIRNNIISKRILVGSTMLFSIIFSTIFIAGLYSAFRSTKHFPDVQTLEEVDKSGVRMKTSIDPFSGSQLELYKRLQKKLILNAKVSSDLNFVATGMGAGIVREANARFLISTNYTDSNGSPLLHIVPDCPKNMFLGFIVQTGSPYLRSINYILAVFKESGLVNKWSNDFTDVARLELEASLHHGRKAMKVIDMGDVIAAFWILAFGFSIASIAFCVEIYKGNLKRCVKNDYFCN